MVGVIFTLAYVIVFSIVLSGIYSNCKKQAENLAKETSTSYAKDVTDKLNVLQATATGLDNAVINNMNAGFKSRNEVIEMQKDILGKYPEVYGVTVAFEPNMYDGNDSKYKGDIKYGANGMFIPYVTRDGTGYHVEAAYDNTTDMTWYDVPKETKKVFVTEPTTYVVNGKNVSMASLVMPILDKSGNFMGVVSFDYQLNTLEQIIKSVKTLGGGAILISKNGLIIANGVDNSALMSNITSENKSQWNSILDQTKNGIEVSEYGAFTKDGHNSYLFAAPVNLDGTQTNWSLVNIIPVANVFADFYNMLWFIIPIAIVVLIIMVVLMSFVSGFISRGIKYAENHLGKIAMGDISIDVDPKFLKFKDEVGNLARQMQVITDNLREKALIAEKISNGDINVSISEKSDKDVLSKSMKKMALNIRELINEAVKLSESAVDGKIGKRGDEQKFSGGYREIIAGVNGILNAVSEPVDEVCNVVSRMSVNDYTLNVKGSYKGAFKILGEDVNKVSERLESIQNDMVLISKGNIGRLEKVKSIGKLSDNDNLTPAMIAMMQNIDDLITEVNRITQESVNGNIINARGNSENFEGGFGKIINGFNATLDSISTPLQSITKILNDLAGNNFTTEIDCNYKGDYEKLIEAVKSVAKSLIHVQNTVVSISAGDISELDNFRASGKKSQNDKLRPAFIQMMENIQALIDESTRIAKSAADGNLEVRSTEYKFEGGYAEIISSINNLLSAVEDPINEVNRVMTAIADCKLSERIDNVYKGEFKVLADSVNETSDFLDKMIGEISDTMEKMSQGNFSMQRVNDFSGDFARISISINSILDALNELLGSINSTSEEVATGSIQVAQGSQSLSQGASEQTSAVEELTASISEISVQTRQSALSASEANKLVTEVKEDASGGKADMNRMLDSMAQISEASSNISKIIRVIDDIAFQTNILALNAAVEAARAGQNGKGFAVVAEEVRNLAAKSAQAAKETSSLIEGSISKAKGGKEIANNTAKALAGIVEGINKVSEYVKNIAGFASEQATNISQIDSALQQVSQVTQTVAATAEESAAASEQLTGQANLLKQQISEFNLRKCNS